MSQKLYRISGENLDLSSVAAVLEGELVRIVLTPQAIRRVLRSRALVEKILQGTQTVYGINTGFGGLAHKKISPAKIEALQKNLILSHSAGVGRWMSKEAVRLAMLFRINALAKGYSGIRLSTLHTLIQMFNKAVTPLVREQGSLCASGDLAPLAELVLVMIGQGRAFYKGRVLSGAGALKRAKIKPVILSAKEGLALINGTQVTAAFLAESLYLSQKLLKVADLAAAMSLEGLKGSVKAFDHKIHAARPHRGQVATANNLRKLL